MALAETARLIASLELDSRKFNANADKAIGKLSKLGVKGVAVGTALGRGLERLAEAGIRKVVGAVTGGLDSLATLENATTSVTGAIKQVGLTGKVTSAQVAAWANEIEASIGAAFDDKDITAASATLLRYGKVTPKNLKPAMQVMTDLAAKTGSVESASSLLAKALAAPEKAAGKLARVGVILTKGQQKQIAVMVKAGDAAGAQKVLLDALAKTTKGAAAATQGPYQRSLSILRDTVEDAQRALATGLLPVLMEVRDELARELAKPATLQRIKDFGQGLADGFRALVKFVKEVPWDTVGSVLKGAVDFGKNLAGAFMGLPTEAKGLILGLAALNKLSGGAVIKVGVDLLSTGLQSVFGQFLGRGSPANPMWVQSIGGVGGGAAGGAAGAAGGAAAGLLGTVGLLAGFAAIGESLGRLPGELEAFSRGLTALNTKDLPGARNAFDDFINGLPEFNPFGPNKAMLRDALASNKTGERVNKQPTGMSPDERQVANNNAARIVRAVDTESAQVARAIAAQKLAVTVNVNASITTGSVARARIVKATYSRGHVGAMKGAGIG